MTDRTAKVEDLDALKSLKRALAKFAESASLSLTDAESEMTRALMWLETEQRSYWEGQLRKRAELVERCKEAVRMKKIFKDSSGRTPSAVDEEKALRLAIKRVEEAEQKAINVKKYTAKLRKDILMYKGQVQRFATAVQNDLPVAGAQLEALFERLRQYVALETPEAVRSAAESTSQPSDGGPVHESMSRGQSPELLPPEPPRPPEPDEPPEAR